eukprot:CAMPEP_0176082282 /NCGR_PEP_ID=MMETSP0120_2-20121206/41158_1 /TAXON_ID=160619 /ORGANISM="Kryptoperidinium foliaceum, Strain CCMP 1326" /LENGTH=147 /DNA_ID=CAMNT_0017416049 /DNA_START=18 /DNA_END=461 /DNA_ORIENTATION=-
MAWFSPGNAFAPPACRLLQSLRLLILLLLLNQRRQRLLLRSGRNAAGDVLDAQLHARGPVDLSAERLQTRAALLLRAEPHLRHGGAIPRHIGLHQPWDIGLAADAVHRVLPAEVPVRQLDLHRCLRRDVHVFGSKKRGAARSASAHL